MKKQILLKKISFCKINLSSVPCSMRYQTQFESFFTITSVFQISSEKYFEHPRSKSVSITSSGTRRNSKNSRHSDSSKSFRSNQNSKGSSPCNIGQKKLNTKEIAREMFLHCLHGICIRNNLQNICSSPGNLLRFNFYDPLIISFLIIKWANKNK